MKYTSPQDLYNSLQLNGKAVLEFKKFFNKFTKIERILSDLNYELKDLNTETTDTLTAEFTTMDDYVRYYIIDFKSYVTMDASSADYYIYGLDGDSVVHISHGANQAPLTIDNIFCSMITFSNLFYMGQSAATLFIDYIKITSPIPFKDLL